MDENCMLYAGFKNPSGYAISKIRGTHKTIRVHREMFIAFKGDIAEGLQIDHLCRNRCCINPEHLEAVTPLENTRRSHNPRFYTDKCNKGHDLSIVGYWVGKKNEKNCKECKRIYRRRPENALYQRQYRLRMKLRG